MNYKDRYIAYLKDNPEGFWFKRKIWAGLGARHARRLAGHGNIYARLHIIDSTVVRADYPKEMVQQFVIEMCFVGRTTRCDLLVERRVSKMAVGNTRAILWRKQQLIVDFDFNNSSGLRKPDIGIYEVPIHLFWYHFQMALTAAQRKLHRAKMGNLWRDLVIIGLGILITLYWYAWARWERF